MYILDAQSNRFLVLVKYIAKYDCVGTCSVESCKKQESIYLFSKINPVFAQRNFLFSLHKYFSK